MLITRLHNSSNHLPSQLSPARKRWIRMVMPTRWAIQRAGGLLAWSTCISPNTPYWQAQIELGSAHLWGNWCPHSYISAVSPSHISSLGVRKRRRFTTLQGRLEEDLGERGFCNLTTSNAAQSKACKLVIKLCSCKWLVRHIALHISLQQDFWFLTTFPHTFVTLCVWKNQWAGWNMQ